MIQRKKQRDEEKTAEDRSDTVIQDAAKSVAEQIHRKLCNYQHLLSFVLPK